MTEQDLGIDPKTGKKKPPKPGSDARQNENYTRHTDIAENARDYSRPHTIPPDEYEAVTGQPHAEAVAEYQQNERKRQQDEKDAAAKAAAE